MHNATKLAKNSHPGDVLNLDFVGPLGISYYRLAEVTGIPTSRLYEIRDGRRSITADTALRLERAFPGVNAQFWLNLQSMHDLSAARRAGGKSYEQIKPIIGPGKLAVA
jgi:addiction module HigA family antidote